MAQVSPATARSRYVLKTQPHSSHSILQRLLPEKGQGRRLLDVGCANGYLSRLFCERGYRVTGIDSCERPAVGFSETIHFFTVDLDRGLPKIEGAFDYIICADVLEHLYDPNVLLRELRARLATGGKLIASLPNSGNIYFRASVLMGRFPSQDRGLFDRTHLHFFMWNGWKNLLRAHSFHIESVEPSAIPFSLMIPKSPRLGEALESAYMPAARTWKSMFAYQFLVVATAA
jgi:SAM-dependent methyltransferase